MPPEIPTPESDAEAMTEAQERSNIVINTKANQFTLARNMQGPAVEFGIGNLKANEAFFEQDLALEDFPPDLQQQMQGKFKGLGKLALDRIKTLEKTTDQFRRDELLGNVFYAVQSLKADCIRLAQNPAIQRTSPLSIAEMDMVLRQYESMFPPIYPPQNAKGWNPNMQNQVSVAGRLALLAFGGTYTAYALFAGWKSGNLGPAMGGMAVTAASIFGVKRLLGGTSERLLSEMKFMEDGRYHQFMQFYGIHGKEWAEYIEDLQKKNVTMRKVRKIANDPRKPDETEEDYQARKSDSMFELLEVNTERGETETEEEYQARMAGGGIRPLEAPKSPIIRMALERMLTSGREDDIGRLLMLANGSRSKDAKDTILKYIEFGGSPECFRIARNPRVLEEPAPVPETGEPPLAT